MTALRVKRSFSWGGKSTGVARTYREGQPVDSNDPAVAANPTAFEEFDEYIKRVSAARPGFGRPVERATAEPGERRSVTPKPSQDDDEPVKPVEKPVDSPAARRTPVKPVVSSVKGKQDGEV
jgi:hypothetical protein